MTLKLPEKYFASLEQWRKWLSENYNKNDGIWFIYLKKGSTKTSISYEESVNEALCFGWIDSIIRKIDDEKYARKFTPRKDSSRWSESNKKRIAQLIRENRMAAPGMAKVNIAKTNGMWDAPDRPEIPDSAPAELQAALDKNPQARQNFNTLPPSQRKHYIAWIHVAKKAETKTKRVAEAIQLLEKNERLGLR
jgi:uncharacterized protein YdeI (YjbR/CyaY-like superfamily)